MLMGGSLPGRLIVGGGANERCRQVIVFPSGSSSLAGYVARPEGSGPFPVVIVIHEIHGLNDNIRNVAHRFAEAGYAALAVDLFAGRNRVVCMARFFGGMFLNSLDHGGIGDLKAALTYFANRPGVEPSRMGAIASALAVDSRLRGRALTTGRKRSPLFTGHESASTRCRRALVSGRWLIRRRISPRRPPFRSM